METYLTNEENDMEIDEIAEINELANMLAQIGIEEEIDEEYEAMMDAQYAEHEARMHAANSYDEDAISYGEMI